MIYRAEPKHSKNAACLAVQMWEDNTVDGLAAEFERLLSDEDAAVFIMNEDGRDIGFAQCQLRRDYVEGTETSPVGYLEGIFIENGYRMQGRARQLLEHCQSWAKYRGCTEFASDCELDNEESLAFHLSVGFAEVNRVICFAKKL